jgi:hypothetical protein
VTVASRVQLVVRSLKRAQNSSFKIEDVPQGLCLEVERAVSGSERIARERDQNIPTFPVSVIPLRIEHSRPTTEHFEIWNVIYGPSVDSGKESVSDNSERKIPFWTMDVARSGQIPLEGTVPKENIDAHSDLELLILNPTLYLFSTGGACESSIEELSLGYAEGDAKPLRYIVRR